MTVTKPINDILPETEEATLIYLYNHPKRMHSTGSMAAELEDNSRTLDEIVAELKASTKGLGGIDTSKVTRTRRVSDVQKDIESLIVKGLIHGKLDGHDGATRHSHIQLTQRGQVAAIRAKGRAQANILDSPEIAERSRQVIEMEAKK